MTVPSDSWQFAASVKSLFMAGTMAIAAIASATVADAQGGNALSPDFAQVHVMTRNLYDGIDYKKLYVQQSINLAEILDAIKATDPGARAALHPRQIAQEHPDLLAIQEAVLAQLNGITQVDMLLDLVGELETLGTPYKIIVTTKGLDTWSGSPRGGDPIRISIWSAILVRSDLPQSDRVVIGEKQGLYTLSLPIMTAAVSDPNDLTQPNANLNFRRNWMWVDMRLRGHAFRFVTTQLDYFADFPKPAQQQAAELIAIISNTSLPVVVTGDFNYRYEDFPALAAAGYRDAWIENGGDGATWCQGGKTWCCLPPLTAPCVPMRTEKIDLILLGGDVSATSARLIGATAAQCSGQGCTHWASDHAGVVAGLVFPSAINFGLLSAQIEELMSAADFKRSGLHKLDTNELASLNRWLFTHPLTVTASRSAERLMIPNLLLAKEGTRGCPGKASASEVDFVWETSDDYCEDTIRLPWADVESLAIDCSHSSAHDFCDVWITSDHVQCHFEGSPERRIVRLPALLLKHNKNATAKCISCDVP